MPWGVGNYGADREDALAVIKYGIKTLEVDLTTIKEFRKVLYPISDSQYEMV